MRDRQTPRILAALAVIALGGPVDRARGAAAPRPGRHSAPPPLDGSLWRNLSRLRAYHADSTLVYAAAGLSEALRWSEDVHGADYHLRETITIAGVPGAAGSAATPAPASDLYDVGGHLYSVVAGRVTDDGALGTQTAAPIMAATIGYWTALGRTDRNVHDIGPVTVAGRLAERYAVHWGVALPAGAGTRGLPGTGTPRNASFTNTVDVDRATGAPLHVAGAYHAGAGSTQSRLTTTFSVTRIGAVGVIKVPASAP